MKVGRVRVILAAAAMTAVAAPAGAAWNKATSKHFEVYADMDERALRAQAVELEMFDAVMRRFQHLPDHPDAEFNKVTVYVLPSIAAVQALHRGRDNIAGFYIPRVTGSVAFTPRAGDRDGDNALSPRIVLFHEYAHHFLLGNYALAYPSWFSEGYAEFASTTMEKGGDYWVGGPAQHRAYSLLERGKDLTAAQLFAPPTRMDEWQIEALYARGWLLTHMIEFDPVLREQFDRYLTRLNAGVPSPKAAAEAFGDMKALDRKMDAYLRQSTVPAKTIKRANLPDPRVDLRPLTAGEAALIRMRMESTRGVDDKIARPLWARAAKVADRCKGDAVAQGWLAEMATDAGDLPAAEAAADAALAVDPAQSQALLYKARVHLARLLAAKSQDPAGWKEARSWIIKANRAQSNDAAALAVFYTSFDMEGTRPSKGAVAGLYRAVELVPQDQGLRFAAARQKLLDEDTDGAKAMLRPLAFDPHAGPDNLAARLLTLLESGANGQTALDALKKAAEEADKRATD